MSYLINKIWSWPLFSDDSCVYDWNQKYKERGDWNVNAYDEMESLMLQ